MTLAIASGKKARLEPVDDLGPMRGRLLPLAGIEAVELVSMTNQRTPIRLNGGKPYSAVTKTNRRAREGAEIA